MTDSVATNIRNHNSSRFEEIPGRFDNFLQEKLQENIFRK